MARHYPQKNIARKIEREDVPGAEVWVYELFATESSPGTPFAYGWKSTREINHNFHHRFKDTVDRDRFITRWFDLRVRAASAKKEYADKKQALRAQPNPFKLRDVLVNSWGYDQTNIDFYQVVGLTACSVKLRRIASEIVNNNAQGLPDESQSMADRRVARRDQFIGEKVLTKRVQWAGADPCVCMDHGWCGLWNGKPEYCSYYA